MPALNDRPIRFGVLAALVAAAASASPAAAQQPKPKTYRSFPYLTAAGDLTADGLADTLTNETIYEGEVEAVASYLPTPVVTARRGAEGSILWQEEIRADLLLPAPLGQEAAPGVLLVDGAYAGSAGAGGGSVENIGSFGESGQLRYLTLTALDGSGGVVWERSFDTGGFVGVVTFTQPEGRRQVVAAKQYPVFQGLIQATPSPAMDALVTILDRREVDDQIDTTLTVAIVDGADGRLASQMIFVTQGTRPAALVGGDLDGDRLDDVLLARYPGDGELTALRGAGLQTLWTNDDDVVPFEAYAEDLGDVTGDGIDDVAIRGFGDFYDTTPPSVTVFDGANGSVLFETIATSITSVGPVAGDSAGLLAQLYDHLDTEVEYRLLDAQGTLLAQRDVFVADDDEQTYVSMVGEAGDLNGDGVMDVGHLVRRNPYEEDASEKRTFLNGRTLATLLEDGGIPLGSSLDEAGDDLLLVERASGSALTVTAQGGDGSSRWTRTLSVDGAYPLMGRVAIETAIIDGDQVPDVILNVETTRFVETTGGGSSSESITQAWVLRGADGSTLWSV